MGVGRWRWPASGQWRIVGVVSTAHFFSHLYLLSFPPLFPLFESEFHLSNFQLSLIVAVISVANLFQMPVGDLADRYGGKWILVAGIATTALGVIAVGLAQSYPAIVAFALISGIGQAAIHPADFRILNEVSVDSNLGKAFSLHMFGGQVGFATAPLVVGLLAYRYDWRLALVTVGLAGLVFAAAVALSVDVPHTPSTDNDDEEDEPSSFLGAAKGLLNGPLLAMFAFFFVFASANKGLQSFLTILFTDALSGTAELGNLSLTLLFGSVAVGILVGGVLADRMAPHRTIAVAATVGAVGIWYTSAASETVAGPLAIGLFSVVGFALGVVIPSRDRLVSALSTDATTGKSFGLVFTGIPVAGLLSLPLLGLLIDAATVSVGFLAIGGFLVAGAVIALLLGSTSTAVRSSIPSSGPG